MAALGVLPQDVYCMTIAEVNLYTTQRNTRIAEVVITHSWRTINFLGAFFSGKLKALDNYLPKTPEREAEQKAKDDSLKAALAARDFKNNWR